ncbi:unnamed protein product, partial [Schistosoma turkestanicum]
MEFNSLAAQSGQIMNGDQLLGINGQRIQSREHVIDLFQQSKSKVVLLIARENYCHESRTTVKENTSSSILPKTLNTTPAAAAAAVATTPAPLTPKTTTSSLDLNNKLENESNYLAQNFIHQNSQTCSSSSIKELSSNELCTTHEFSSNSTNKNCSDFP